MATLLAHIRIKPGCEEQWEEIMQAMVRDTFANEKGVLRYEYWKGEEPNLWYSLLSFVDKQAFFVHQDSEHHRTQSFGDVIEAIRLEFLDPVEGASDLPRTADLPLPEDAPPGIRQWEKITPVKLADWWKARR